MRAELNRLINEERSAGRLEVTPGSWDEIWRAEDRAVARD